MGRRTARRPARPRATWPGSSAIEPGADAMLEAVVIVVMLPLKTVAFTPPRSIVSDPATVEAARGLPRPGGCARTPLSPTGPSIAQYACWRARGSTPPICRPIIARLRCGPAARRARACVRGMAVSKPAEPGQTERADHRAAAGDQEHALAVAAAPWSASSTLERRNYGGGRRRATVFAAVIGYRYTAARQEDGRPLPQSPRASRSPAIAATPK